MKAIQRVIGTFSVMGQKRVPFAAVKVTKNEAGEREIAGVKAFTDSLPEIPLGRRTGSGEWIAYSRNEREAMAAEIKAKAERASKKEAKQDAYDALPIAERAKIEAKKAAEKAKRASKKGVRFSASGEPYTPTRRIRPVHGERTIIGAGEGFNGKPGEDQPMVTRSPRMHTVKRDGRWVQVGSDNLSAFIEAR